MDAVDNGLYVDDPVVRHSGITTVTVPNASAVQLVQASAKRKKLTIITDGTNVVAIGQQNPLDFTRVIRIFTTQPQLHLDADVYGSMIQGNWFAQAAVAAVAVSVIDTVG